VEVEGVGLVHTFTVLFKNLDGSKKEEPEIIALIHLDEADGGVVHRLGECDPVDVHFGLAVEAVLKPEAEREGSIQDILYFKPC
jgi:hypothetical protein